MASAVVKGVGLGIPVAGIGGTGVAYQTTRESVLSVLESKNEVIVDKDDSAWDSIFNAFKGKQESNFKTEKFKGLLKDAKEDTPKLDKKGLYKSCSEQLNKDYKSIFSGAKENLLEDIITACTITVGGVLGDTSYATEKANLNSDTLKNYNESSSPKLTTETKAIKDKLSKSDQEEDAKDAHAGWCKKEFNSKYKGEDEDYKVFKEICKKKS